MKLPLLICLSIITFQLPAQNFWKRNITGEGPIITRELNLKNFDGVHNGYACDVYLSQGEDYKVLVEGQENIIDNLKFDIEDRTLKIKYDRMVRRASKVKIYITMPNLREIALSGSGNMKTTNHFGNSNNLRVSLSGSGNVYLDIASRSIDARMSGSGSLKFAGASDDLEISISGSGNLDAEDLKTGECSISISGSGNASVYVSDRLEAKVSGSGKVRYRGDVAQVHSNVSGSGSVRSF
ncbi:MAG: DUF2807 domain-containing protein [Saprospiraceae bacterium]|nr:DUF2807 domain-containing protein [Saprospiraceae bacterium]